MIEPDKYLSFHFQDIIIEPENVNAAIIQSCRRNPTMGIRSVGQVGNDVLVVLSPTEFATIPAELYWLDISALSYRDLVPLLQERWQSGFTPLGTISDETPPGKRFLLLQRCLAEMS